MDLQKFAERLLKSMRDNSITAEELADKTQIKLQRINRILAGERLPRLQELYDLCVALKASPDFLLGIEEMKKRKN